MKPLIYIFYILLPLTTYAEEAKKSGGTEYKPLAGDGLNFLTGDLTEFLQNTYFFMVGIAVAASIVMIVIGGVEMMTTDSLFKRGSGKKKIQGALSGLALALGSWLILNFINPKLVNVNFNISTVPIKEGSINQTGTGNAGGGVGGGTPGGGGTGGSGTVGVGNIVQMPSGISVKPGSGTQVDASFATKLLNFNSLISTYGISWRVTEACPPTRDHQNSCHQKDICTCVDANFSGGSGSGTNAQIKAFIDAAKTAGIKPVYEMATQARKNELIAAGVPEENLSDPLGSWIDGEHFSLYNN